MSNVVITSADILNRWHPVIESHLREYMQRDSDCPPRLQAAMSYSLLAGGKRLRPVLVLLACEACGGQIESALPAACAIEMIHTYSLIHDDLPAMDDDDLRRGQPTNHVQFGEAMAILAGDALLTLAFEVLAKDIQPPGVAASCCVDLAGAAGASGMVGGQVADLEAENIESPTLEQLEYIHLRKTGRLLRCALTLGARVANATPDTIAMLDTYGRCLGLAFQITDDLLDITSNSKKMGKEVRKDADHGKLTYPAFLGLDASRCEADELIDRAIRVIQPLGKAGRHLEVLAHFVRERDH